MKSRSLFFPTIAVLSGLLAACDHSPQRRDLTISERAPSSSPETSGPANTKAIGSISADLGHFDRKAGFEIHARYVTKKAKYGSMLLNAKKMCASGNYNRITLHVTGNVGNKHKPDSFDSDYSCKDR
jgi:hypothetical protein